MSKKTIRGIRDTIPAGYLMGRIAGAGPAQLIRVAAIRKLGSPNLGVQAISELTGDVLAGPGSGQQTATIANGAVTEAKQTLADNTTWNVSTTKHGYVPKLPNDATKFLNGVGAWAVPSGGGGGGASAFTDLTDVPASYSGQSLKSVRVNVGETALEFYTPTAVPTAANPTATASDAAVNGSASTFMRSDGAPAIQKASSSQFGVVKVDGTTITESGGVISAPGGGGSGALTFVGSTTVSGSAATTITVSGLDLDTDKRYLIKYSVKNATNTSATISLFFNADTTATNYNRQVQTADGASVTSARANDAAVGGITGLSAGTRAGDSVGEIWLRNGPSARPMVMCDHMRSGDSNIIWQKFVTEWRTSGTNVTGITLSSAVANSFAIGSTVEVWKLT